ncbi:glycosyltransferase [Thalassospira marina]|uniref:Glycosyl transferase family 1 n=1 Tax=Thalassospira marina TaxID=2048283 RepID=A0ABN5FJK6_9PROT|nr:glycosyltransferase [Thalassospira marina]AUG54543.1 glycosyl transferase family 1 [Thalassospira marina]
MKKFIYIQSFITLYREPVILALAKKFRLTIMADLNPEDSLGYNTRGELPAHKYINSKRLSICNHRLLFQPHVDLMSLREIDGILIDANIRLVSLWLLLFRCRLSGVKLYLHGQGAYRVLYPRLIHRILFKTLVNLSTTYICYNDAARKTLIDIGCSKQKLAVANNSLNLKSIVVPKEKTGTETGILFIGRLRERCRLEILLNAISDLRSNGQEITAHVIGTGELESFYRKKYSNKNWIIWHGNIFEDSKIAEISRQCRVGCYPGDAGLSIVHYFGLSLPPIVHDQMHRHMGPEPHYIQEGINGFLFSPGNLSEKLKEIWLMPTHKIHEISTSAQKSYWNLNTPPLGEKILEIINRSEDSIE